MNEALLLPGKWHINNQALLCWKLVDSDIETCRHVLSVNDQLYLAESMSRPERYTRARIEDAGYLCGRAYRRREP
jgi:hypothetical protein